ncbi:MAG: hypothetical protein RJQ07_04370 [Pseudomonadales bacterium]
MRRFDSKALYKALEHKRKEEGLSWSDISREIGVSASTITRTKHGGRMEVDGMIAMVDWLEEKVETFITDSAW